MRGNDKLPPATSPPLIADRTDPPAGLPYPSVLRKPGSTTRCVTGAVLALLLYLVVTGIVPQLIIGLGYLGERALGHAGSWTDYYAAAIAFERPVGMLAQNLGIAAVIPVMFVLVAYWHATRPRWLVSVQPGMRWRYLIICLVTSVIGTLAVLLVSFVVDGWPTFTLQPSFVLFVVFVVLTSPLQAAAEEFLFRGYLMQALGGLVATPWFGIIATAVVFALLHGAQNAPLFLSRLAFGLLAGILVWRTGGLEAAIAAHVANNVLTWLLAGTTTSIAATRSVVATSWEQAAFNVGGFAVVAVLGWLVGRWLKVATRTP